MRKAGKDSKRKVAPTLLPTLSEAIGRWQMARRVFLRRTGRKAFADLNEATTILFATFLGDDSAQPWASAAFSSFRSTLIASEADAGCWGHVI